MRTAGTSRGVNGYVSAHQRKKKWLTVVTGLAAAVVFCTVYALILPAITLESGVYCGMTEHTHGEECWQEQLVCGLEEGEGHVHTGDCYEETEVLACGLEESEGHAHGEGCYDESGALICGLEETEGHAHSEECYEAQSALVCTLPEGEPHTHTESCYESVLVCGLEEHTHSEACGINTAADVETAADWEATLPEELTGVWADDLLAVAGSQMGYAESTSNYVLTEDGAHKGYTRYGAWYGMPYEDWCAMFVSFCLNYADVPAETMPRASACQSWIDTLSQAEWNLYAPAHGEEAYLPKPGDLIFFDFNQDGASDHVGIVAEYTEAAAPGTPAELKTIEGNSSGRVQSVTYDPAAPEIMGYAMLPEQLTTLTAGGEDYTVTVTYGPDAELPEGVELRVSEYARDSETWLSRYAEAAALYGWDEDRSEGIRLFDVGLYAGGGEVEPAAPVRVTITCAGQESGGSCTVTHFGEAAETVEAESGYTDGARTVDFTLDSFSDIMLAAETGTTVQGVSPVGSTINLFDYWVDRVDEGQIGGGDGYKQAGINGGHALKFSGDGYGTLGTANLWTGDGGNKGPGGVLQGIVSNRLVNGYPQLSGSEIFGNGISSGDDTSASLSYLFNPREEANGKTSYSNVGGLLQIDQDGYYYYNSKSNYAEYDGQTNSFILYNDGKVTHNGVNGQFFPFNQYNAIRKDINAGSTDLNHFFGLTLTTKFIQQYGGHTDATKKTATTFEFSGDDDVWIFIDGVLVADLGGIHDAASVTIDFAAGTVKISKAYAEGGAQTDVVTNFSDIFQDTGVELEGNTLPDETYHTLKFFYLERGGYASNLSLKYNLNAYPRTSIYKVNQYGDVVPGATFAVYAADGNYNLLSGKGGDVVTLPAEYGYDASGNIVASGAPLAQALYVGTTDASGEMIFNDDDGMPATLKELEEKFGDHFILKEIEVPDGYRMVKDEIHLKIANGLLLCDNSYESGVYSTPNLLISAPNEIWLFQEYNGNHTVELAKEVDGNSVKNGTLFAVVMKYVGTGDPATDTNQTSWAPVYGSDKDGYTVTEVTDAAQMVDTVIETAKAQAEINAAQGTSNTFTLSASGAWQANMENLPGDVTKYYNMLGDLEKSQTEFTVGYYWTEADSLAEATVANTHRVNANNVGNVGEQYNFTRAFGASVNVPNLLNRLYAQKLDAGNNLVNGAGFALYEVSETNGTIYYKAEGDRLIYLYPDDGSASDDGIAGNNEGNAKLEDDSTGTYEVDGTSGVITVTVDGTAYTIRPTDAQTTLAQEADGNPSGEDGTATFSNLMNGSYYLREISAPENYLLNAAEVMVNVTDTTVLANAGTKDDGVVVGRGPGYLVESLHFSASQGLVDNTLTWVYGVMRTSGLSATFTDATRSNYYTDWKYITENYWDGTPEKWKPLGDSLNAVSASANTEAATVYLEYNPAEDDVGFNYIANNDRAAMQANAATNRTTGDYARRLYTDVGWSYLELYQDDEYGKAMVPKGTTYEILDGVVDSGDEDETPDGMIADLFSRSVYVQVTDTGESKLEISKTVANRDNDTTEFTFTVELRDETGKELTGRFPYTIYNVAGDGARTQADGDSATGAITSGGAVTLTHQQVVVIEGLPASTSYTVTEAEAGDYTTAYTIDGGTEGEGRSAAGTLKWDAQDNTTTVAYTNTYSPPIDLTVRKVESGNGDVLLGGAQFVLYRTENDTNYYYQNGAFAALPEGGDEAGAALTTASSGTAQGTVTFTGIPAGTYSLKEIKAPDGYTLLTSEITVVIENGAVRTVTPNTIQHESNGTTATVTVPNSTGITLPSTGGAGTTLFTIGGLLLIAGAAGCGYGLRRRRERRAS